MAEEVTGPALVVEGGPIDGFTFPLTQGTTVIVGSGRLAQLRVGGDDVGSAHIKVVWDDNGISVTDNGSATGTFVNNEAIETAVLWDGDRIAFVAPDAKKQPPRIKVRIPPGTVIMPAAVTAEQLAARGDAVAGAKEARRSSPAAPKASATVGGTGRRSPSGVAGLGGVAAKLEGLSLPSVSIPQVSLPRINPAQIGYAAGGVVVLGGLFLLVQALFFSKPVVTAIQPGQAEAGQPVTVSGKRFDDRASMNKVYFGDQGVPAIASTGTTLTVAVPEAPASGGDVSVVVETPRGRSQPVPFHIETPLRVSGLEPEAAMPGDVVIARGAGLAGSGASVTVAGKPATVVEARPDALKFKVPEIAQPPGTALPVAVRVGAAAAKPVDLVLGKLPLVLDVSPPRGVPGDKVTLKGRGFAATPEANAVTFGGVPAFVLVASPRELTVIAPDPGLQRVQSESEVVVQAGGQASTNHAAFVVARSLGGAYVLRFFPAAVAAGNVAQVHVATDLGPVFLLAAPAGAPSLGDRAMRAAAALNVAFDRATSDPAVVFEARTQSAAGIGVAGSPDLVLAATAEDVAAYAASGPAALTPAALAEHWAALANDYLSIFVKNEKPARLLLLSPQGRSLTELRGALAGRTISTERVAALAPDLRARLREAALTPGGGVGGGKVPGAAAAVEGLWEGEMQDQSSGVKRVTVRLRLGGSGLEGTLTNRSSAVSMDVPLKDVSFDKGVLRFVLPAGPATRIFVGKAEGASVSGTLHTSPGGPAVGSFSLRNVP